MAEKEKTIKGRNGGTLTPFKKGHDPRRNIKGTKPTIFNDIIDHLNREKEDVNFFNVDEIDEKGNLLGRKVSVKVKWDTKESIKAHYIRRLKKSDRVLIDFMNREGGKAIDRKEITYKVELNGFDQDLLTDEQFEVFIHLLDIGSSKKDNNGGIYPT